MNSLPPEATPGGAQAFVSNNRGGPVALMELAIFRKHSWEPTEKSESFGRLIGYWRGIFVQQSRAAKDPRLIIELLYLQHAFQLSDEAVDAR